jgi:hypothetical protein
MKQYSDEELKTALRELAAELNKSPTVADIQSRDDLPSRSTFRSRFGSWNDALVAAGLDPNQAYECSRDELLTAIKQTAEQLDCRPTKRDVVDQTQYSEAPFRHEFGSWSNAMTTAGYSAYPQISDEELMEDLREWANYYSRGRTAEPTKRNMDATGPHAASTYAERFGSWTQAVVEAGLNPDTRSIDRDELIAELTHLQNRLGKRPAFHEMEEHGDYSGWPYLREFGSWNAALRAAGYEPRSSGRPEGTTDIPTADLIADLRRIARRWGRTPTEEEYQDHGEYSTTTHSRRFGGWRSAVERAGLEPRRETTSASASDRKLDPEYDTDRTLSVDSGGRTFVIAAGDGIGDALTEMVYEVTNIEQDAIRAWPVGFRNGLYRTLNRDDLRDGFSDTSGELHLTYYYGTDSHRDRDN